MKKLLALLFALLLCVMAACSPAPNETPGESTEPSKETEPQYETITIAQALELCGAEGNITEERYYIRAKVESISNPTYGSMVISDETGSISVYGTYSEDGEIPYGQMTDKPYKGDEVLLHCILQNYNGTKEVKNARLIQFTHAKVEVDESDYTEMSIADARATAEGTKVKVDGVVARITYANGMIPSGVMLVDETGSIYVYDGDLAGRVSIGNKITIAASKTYWILDSEASNAATFGYKGCNQLESVTLIENDGASHDFDKSWIQETTVKDILDTPVTEDITTTIFKVTALIKEVPGSGFTNFYINDLDEKTGTYSYSQCNGSDFEWLRQYDGKVCTVYVTALNAKSTKSDCFFRFLPVAVVDEGFDPTSVNGAEFAVKYHAIDQFMDTYTGNPALELVTNVSSQLLKIEGAKLTYTSSDPSVISIDGNVMNCKKTGTATVTVSCTYGGKTYSQDVTISVTVTQQEQTYPTVAQTIATAPGGTVTVKGIVGPSLVNQTGFYLIDESGVIAIRTDAETMKTLKIGHEVVIQGTRSTILKPDKTGMFGQTCVDKATVVTNNYGSHTYSTATFVHGKTLADFYNLDPATDLTTTVYVMKAIVNLVDTGNFTRMDLIDGNGTSVSLYCSGAGQYSFLKQFAGQEVTVEIAPCNWNSKKYYAGCVLAVYTDGGKVLNEFNFQN